MPLTLLTSTPITGLPAGVKIVKAELTGGGVNPPPATYAWVDLGTGQAVDISAIRPLANQGLNGYSWADATFQQINTPGNPLVLLAFPEASGRPAKMTSYLPIDADERLFASIAGPVTGLNAGGDASYIADSQGYVLVAGGRGGAESTGLATITGQTARINDSVGQPARGTVTLSAPDIPTGTRATAELYQGYIQLRTSGSGYTGALTPVVNALTIQQNVGTFVYNANGTLTATLTTALSAGYTLSFPGITPAPSAQSLTYAPPFNLTIAGNTYQGTGGPIVMETTRAVPGGLSLRLAGRNTGPLKTSKAPTSLSSVTVTGFQNLSDVVVSVAAPDRAEASTPAVVTAGIPGDGGLILSVANPGAGYTQPPVITLTAKYTLRASISLDTAGESTNFTYNGAGILAFGSNPLPAIALPANAEQTGPVELTAGNYMAGAQLIQTPSLDLDLNLGLTIVQGGRGYTYTSPLVLSIPYRVTLTDGVAGTAITLGDDKVGGLAYAILQKPLLFSSPPGALLTFPGPNNVAFTPAGAAGNLTTTGTITLTNGGTSYASTPSVVITGRLAIQTWTANTFTLPTEAFPVFPVTDTPSISITRVASGYNFYYTPTGAGTPPANVTLNFTLTNGNGVYLGLTGGVENFSLGSPGQAVLLSTPLLLNDATLTGVKVAPPAYGQTAVFRAEAVQEPGQTGTKTVLRGLMVVAPGSGYRRSAPPKVTLTGLTPVTFFPDPLNPGVYRGTYTYPPGGVLNGLPVFRVGRGEILSFNDANAEVVLSVTGEQVPTIGIPFFLTLSGLELPFTPAAEGASEWTSGTTGTTDPVAPLKSVATQTFYPAGLSVENGLGTLTFPGVLPTLTGNPYYLTDFLPAYTSRGIPINGAQVLSASAGAWTFPILGAWTGTGIGLVTNQKTSGRPGLNGANPLGNGGGGFPQGGRAGQTGQTGGSFVGAEAVPGTTTGTTGTTGTNQLTYLAPLNQAVPPQSPTLLALSPDDGIYTATGSIVTWPDQTTYDYGEQIADLLVDPLGTLYVLTATGVFASKTLLPGSLPAGESLAISGRTLYVGRGAGIQRYDLNRRTGALTSIADTAARMIVSPDGRLLYYGFTTAGPTGPTWTINVLQTADFLLPVTPYATGPGTLGRLAFAPTGVLNYIINDGTQGVVFPTDLSAVTLTGGTYTPALTVTFTGGTNGNNATGRPLLDATKTHLTGAAISNPGSYTTTPNAVFINANNPILGVAAQFTMTAVTLTAPAVGITGYATGEGVTSTAGITARINISATGSITLSVTNGGSFGTIPTAPVAFEFTPMPPSTGSTFTVTGATFGIKSVTLATPAPVTVNLPSLSVSAPVSPRVIFTTPGPGGTAAIVNALQNPVTSVTLATGGTYPGRIPAVLFHPPGTTGAVTAKVKSVSPDTGGSGYSLTDTLTFGSLTLPPNTFAVNPAGAVTGFTLGANLTGLTDNLPTTPTSSTGAGTGLTVRWTYEVESVQLTHAESYTGATLVPKFQVSTGTALTPFTAGTGYNTGDIIYAANGVQGIYTATGSVLLTHPGNFIPSTLPLQPVPTQTSGQGVNLTLFYPSYTATGNAVTNPGTNYSVKPIVTVLNLPGASIVPTWEAVTDFAPDANGEMYTISDAAVRVNGVPVLPTFASAEPDVWYTLQSTENTGNSVEILAVSPEGLQTVTPVPVNNWVNQIVINGDPYYLPGEIRNNALLTSSGTYSLPPGVTTVQVVVQGARGGGGPAAGLPAEVQATLTLETPEVRIHIGQPGVGPGPLYPGGGASAVFSAEGELLVLAGGGGGAAGAQPGGNAGLVGPTQANPSLAGGRAYGGSRPTRAADGYYGGGGGGGGGSGGVGTPLNLEPGTGGYSQGPPLYNNVNPLLVTTAGEPGLASVRITYLPALTEPSLSGTRLTLVQPGIPNDPLVGFSYSVRNLADQIILVGQTSDGRYTTTSTFSFPLNPVRTIVITTPTTKIPPFTVGPPICFLRGTRILTPTGYTPIEELTLGALVTPCKGDPVPLMDIVHFQETGHKCPLYILPPDALSPGVPSRALAMSNNHAFRFQGKWRHMKCAAAAVRQAAAVVYDYYHLVVPDYFKTVLLAEGVEVETCFRETPQVRMGWLCNAEECIPLKCTTADFDSF